MMRGLNILLTSDLHGLTIGQDVERNITLFKNLQREACLLTQALVLALSHRLELSLGYLVALNLGVVILLSNLSILESFE